MQKYRLPPLDLFRSFEAVARHLSFTAAASELCLTQSAVSRQIAALEQQTGIKLFHRLHRAIELTPAGERLLEAVSLGLDQIQGCLAALGATAKTPRITISATVAFAWFWLMPRLNQFSADHPDIDLRVLASDTPVLPGHGEVDVAILFGSGQWVGVTARLLFRERVYPVCSAAFLREHPGLLGAEDLLRQTLLHLDIDRAAPDPVDWQRWLASQGVAGQPVLPGLRFNSYPMVLQAAEAGRGVALGWSYIVDPIVASGRLVRPVSGSMETRNGYYLSTSKQGAASPELEEFLRWIANQATEAAALA
ncbi:LysR substrate-binding domain-containing protein [Aestuariivirga litoralis]|uniref:LysR substrate-binding domain-containing protein n=1 Tax=Aestuariivirga litoralis TaxID=2650924 RepID=UPI00137A6829|nr:LysR substrate-binding domain-containing protein [Aestuariivirga litoralis]